MRFGLYISLAFLVALVCVAVACDQRSPEPAELAPAAARPEPCLEDGGAEAPPKRGAAARLRRLDDQIEAQTKRVQRLPGRWVELHRLASLYMERRQLSGRFQDLAAAWRAVSAASEIDGVVHAEVDVRVAMAMHRFTEADALVDVLAGRVIPAAELVAFVWKTEGDLAFQRGQWPRAKRNYLKALEYQRTSETVGGYGFFLWRQGDVAGADAAFSEFSDTKRGGSDYLSAWAHVERARLRLELGDDAGACRHVEQALHRFPGYWRARAMRAALAGPDSQAWALGELEALVAETGEPELMEALAQLSFAAGDAPRSRALLQQAGEIWRRRYEEYPEAVASHWAAHLLATGANPQLALRLAREDAARRPGGEPRLLLARALVAASLPQEASQQIDALIASPFWHPQLEAVARQAYDGAGRPEALAAALARMPHPTQAMLR